MKTLKIIFLSLLGIIIAFLGLGLLFPSYEYQRSAEVNASPEACWAAFHDTKRMDKWLKGFESLTLTKGAAMAPGSIYEIVINDDGHRMVMSEKIIQMNAPTKASYELNNDVLKSEFSFSFEGSATTTITCTYKITGNNVLWKSILLVSKSYMTNSAQQQLDALKEVIERQ
jgi:carbon monoxide dehydrogenase subunit G